MGQNPKTFQIEDFEAGLPAIIPEILPTATETGDLIDQAANWFALDVANGDARPDTIATYISHLNHWLTWCRVNHIDPGHPFPTAIKGFRQELVQSGAAHATISLKLTTVRRFYDGAVSRGLLEANPVKDIKAPRKRTADAEIIKCLTAGEAERLFEAIPHDHKLKNQRDRAMTALMTLEGLRRIEICRANVEDIEETDSGIRILVHGKGKDGYIYPREDTVACIRDYLIQRGDVQSDKDGEPIFVSLGKSGKLGGRITRIGLSKWMDTMLAKAGITKKGRACHALRHTCGALLYQATRDVKVVQETLRHASIAMAAKYSHVQDRGKARYTQSIQIKP
jgi:integrase/recombinase XerC/integrase/recombinase XerD